MALGDFDGDGDRDAAVTSKIGNGFEVWTNAAGALGRTALYISGRIAGRPLLVDVDSDLRLDLIHTAPSDGALALARGGGDGTFSAAPSFLLPDLRSTGSRWIARPAPSPSASCAAAAGRIWRSRSTPSPAPPRCRRRSG